MVSIVKYTPTDENTNFLSVSLRCPLQVALERVLSRYRNGHGIEAWVPEQKEAAEKFCCLVKVV